MNFKWGSLRVKTINLVGVRIEEVRKTELLGVCSNQEFPWLLRVLNNFSVSQNDFRFLETMLVLVNQNIKLVFRYILNL
jgi:hypothetical protein